MSDTNGKSSKSNLFWMVITLVLVVIVIIWFYGATDLPSEPDAEPIAETAEIAEPPSTEFTTAPEGGMDVDLPETPMTNVPAEDALVEVD